MLSRRFINNARNLKQVRMAQPSYRYFSSETSEGQSASVSEPSQEEIEKGRHEWGIKYNDECLKFEKEWEIIAQQVENE